MSENLAKYNVVLELITKQKGKGVEDIKKKTGSLQKSFLAAGAAFTGIVSVGAASLLTKRIFDVTKKYQKYNTVLKVALGSQREASKSMKLIEDSASSTVFSVDELTSSYIKFVNRGVKPTQDEIIALADLAASQGKSFDQLTEAALDAQTGEFERLKEFGIKASKQGDKVTFSFKGLNTTINNTPKEINKAIIAFGKMKGVAGSNLQQMQDLEGLMSNIGDTTEKTFKNIGKRLTGIFTGALQSVKKVVELFAEWTDIPLAEKIQNEQIELNVLVQTITDANTSQETRNKLINELQTEYPFFLKNLNAETVSNASLRDRLKEVNKLYVKRIALQSQEDNIKAALKESGDKQIEQVRKEAELRKSLTKIKLKFNLDTNLEDFDNIKDARESILSELSKLFTVTKSFKFGLQVSGSRKAYNAYIDMAGGLDKVKNAANEYAEAMDNVLDEQEIMDALTKKLGASLADINKLFEDGSKVPDKIPPKIPTKSKKKEKSKEQLEYELSVAFAEKSFTMLEENARREIGDAEKLSKELQKIEIEKQIALTHIKQFSLKDNSAAFINLENQRDQLKRDLNKLNRGGKISVLDSLFDVNDSEDKFKKNVSDKIKAMIDELESEADSKDNKPILQKLLGLDDDQFSQVASSIDSMKNSINELYDTEISKIDQLIDKQKERVEEAEKMAEKGKVKQLKIEEERLTKLNEKRRKYAEQQKAIAQTEILTANAVSAAKSIQAITEAFAAGGPAGIITGVATSLALIGQIAVIGTTINSAFSDIPAFRYGVDAFGNKSNGKVTGKGTGTSDSVLSRLSRDERVTPADINKQIGLDFPNAKLPDAVRAYKILPSVMAALTHQSQSKSDIGKLSNEIKDVKLAIESMKIVTKLDKDGFIQQIQRSFDDVIRRNEIRG